LVISKVMTFLVAIGTVQGAQIALGPGGQVHVVWNGSQPSREPGSKGVPMSYSRLNAARTGFEPQRNLMTRTMNLEAGGSDREPLSQAFAGWQLFPFGVSWRPSWLQTKRIH